jgi:hypothetical protein
MCPDGGTLQGFGAAACTNAVCGYQCDPGYTACQGVCKDTTRDVQACGACNVLCSKDPSYNGIQTCSAGACMKGACLAGWATCGSACAVLSSDTANCGACGVACAAGQACQAGQCLAASSLVLASASMTDDLILDGGAIFFSNQGDGSVRKVSAGGGPVTTLATGQARPVRLAADGTYVYWSSYLGGAIVRTLEDGTGTPAVIAPASSP